jgi:ParB family transcriptional regulator, chromosome partitioning protein
MRMPWAKSKGEQLELLDGEPASVLPAPSVQPIPVRPIGEPLLVSIAGLDEDPENPRTEVPEDELAELTEDIRQRGILQPIVVHPPDAAGRYRIHFGARRWRAAQLAGLDKVPIVVRDAPADPYAQVAENQKRHGLTPLDLARFIRGRIDAGESNSGVARRLGMNLTTVAHHLALLDLPPVLDGAMKSGRCTSPRTLHELGKLHDQDPEQVQSLLSSGAEITRAKVTELRTTPPAPSAQDASGPPSAKLIAEAIAACGRFEQALKRLDPSNFGTAPNPELDALLARLEGIAQRWRQGSARQTPAQAER